MPSSNFGKIHTVLAKIEITCMYKYLLHLDLLDFGQNVFATARELGHIRYPSKKLELLDATSYKPPI